MADQIISLQVLIQQDNTEKLIQMFMLRAEFEPAISVFSESKTTRACWDQVLRLRN